MSHDPGKADRRLRWGRKRWIAAGVVVLALIGWWTLGSGDSDSTNVTTFAARRGDLEIQVLGGGSVEALESQLIKSEVKGQTKILSIVEEGYLVTEQDVEEKKVLVTLDDSELNERLTQAEIEFQSARAAYTDAREQYEIQIKQNESDIKEAELLARFARLDFAKYLGQELADSILEKLSLDVALDTESLQADERAVQERVSMSGSPDESRGETDSEDVKLPEEPPSRISIALEARAEQPDVDFSQYAEPDKLGDGAAQQQLRKLISDRLLAAEELDLAETRLAGTRRLAEKNFVIQQELDSEEMKVRKNKVALESAETEEELFIRYEFPKEAERFLSDFEEALRKLERTRKQAIAKYAQAEAKMISSEASFNLRVQHRQELIEQLEACTIEAERPGLVVYAGSGDAYRRQEPIEEGGTVFERQEIITIPDMTEMAVNVKVHESSIKKVKRGQRAVIRIDAYPDEELEGEVTKISVLPDSSRRWMNPDIKLYPVMVTIKGVHEWLKPSMSAQVEIEVKTLKDVIYVPIHAVDTDDDGDRFCVVSGAMGGPKQTMITTGEFNDEFIEIKDGLEEGDLVWLRTPDGMETPGNNNKKPKDESGEESNPV